MQPLDIVVSSLKWLSQFVVLVSATSAMFQELYVKDPETGRRRLTRSGWVHLTGLLLGFVLFGVTEIHDQQKAARERIEAATNETRLQSLLEKQKTIEQGLRTQIELGKTLQNAQQIVIENQADQNSRLKDLVLASYQLSGVQLTLDAPKLSHARFANLFERTKEDLRASGQPLAPKFDQYWQYFETCLEHGDFQATKGERDQWEIRCRLGRPQGITSPSLYCPPDTYQWRVFEGLLEMWFSRRFAVQITGGPDLVLIDSGARPSMISRKSGELTATIVGTRVKIGQLNNAKITLRIDKSVTERNELFVTVRLKSLDPLVEFDKKVDAKWTPTKIGTEKIALDVADDPQDVDIVVLTAGPMPLPVRVDPRLLAVENERPRK